MEPTLLFITNKAGHSTFCQFDVSVSQYFVPTRVAIMQAGRRRIADTEPAALETPWTH
jgi:hypothetical protein